MFVHLDLEDEKKGIELNFNKKVLYNDIENKNCNVDFNIILYIVQVLILDKVSIVIVIKDHKVDENKVQEIFHSIEVLFLVEVDIGDSSNMERKNLINDVRETQTEGI